MKACLVEKGQVLSPVSRSLLAKFEPNYGILGLKPALAPRYAELLPTPVKVAL
jgi:hypothetical protein